MIFSQVLDNERRKIYSYYQRILNGENPQTPKLEGKLEEISRDEYIYWEGRIIDNQFLGKNYFFGKILDKLKMTPSHSDIEYSVIIALPESEDFHGIKTFEEFNNRDKRKIMVRKEHIIAQASSLNELRNDKEKLSSIRYALDTLSQLRKLRK